MGMFDSIVVNYPLPDGVNLEANKSWQTKSLDCQLHVYEITSEGRLLLLNAPHSDEGVSIDQQMHGEITFYEMIGKCRTPSEKWLEYTATFVKGDLTGIEPNHKTHEVLEAERKEMKKSSKKYLRKMKSELEK